MVLTFNVVTEDFLANDKRLEAKNKLEKDAPLLLTGLNPNKHIKYQTSLTQHGLNLSKLCSIQPELKQTLSP